MSTPATRLGLVMINELRRAIIRRGYSQAAWAQKLGVKKGYVKRVLNGRTAISLTKMEEWARILDAEWDISLDVRRSQ